LLYLDNRLSRFEDGVRIERDTINPASDQKPGEFWVIAWGLAANPDLRAARLGSLGHVCDQLFDCRVAFIKQVGLGIAFILFAAQGADI
jgi:hypothetical protein